MKNHKYHYLYKITNQITGEYYYGVHSTNNLKDGYFGSGSMLHANIRDYGKENFIKEILEFFPTRKDLMNEEKRIVNIDKLSDPLCLNIILGGGETKGSLGKKCVVDNNGQYIMVDKNNQDYIGFMKGRKCINKDGIIKYVKPYELKSYELDGWKKGTFYDSPGKGKIWIHKDDRRTHIYLSEVDKYVAEGWEVGIFGTGKKTWVNKDGIVKQIFICDLNKYISEGWVKGTNKSAVSGKICITKENITKYVKKQELNKYLNEGWERKKWNNYIWVNKSGVNKRVEKCNLQSYIDDGWCTGRYYEKSPKARGLLMYDLEGNLIHEFIRVTDAVKQGYNNVSLFANKDRVYLGKYILKYTN